MKSNPSRLFEMNVSVRIGFVIAFFAFTLCLLFVLYPDNRIELTFVSSTIGISAAIYSAFYLGHSVRNNTSLVRKKHSFDLILRTKCVELMKIRTQVEHEFPHHKIISKDLYSAIVKNRELHTGVKALLCLFEDISIAIQSGYADEEVIFQSQVAHLAYLYKTFLPYIEGTRKKRDDDRVYCELEKLAKTWSAGKKLSA